MPRHRIVFNGELVTRLKLYLRASTFLSTGLLWLIFFLLIPTLLLTLLAFATRGPYGEVIFWEHDDHGKIIWQFTTEHFRKLAGFGSLGWSADYLWITARTLWFATATTIISVALAYPVAFFVAAHGRRGRYLWLLAIMIPFCTNLVIRLYAWQLLLSPGLPPAKLASFLGLIGPSDGLYPSTFAVYSAMIMSNLPFAVLPLVTNVERIDWSLVEAARDLYASPTRIFRHAILPQTLPALQVAFVLTFIPALGTFLVPDLLGGAKSMLLGNLIQQQFGASRNFPFGAAISFVLMIGTFIALHIFLRDKAKEAAA
jgi:spermidine/putrescine transport system permease protein